MNGDDGRDDVEVNGAPTAGDVFTVQPNGARIKFDRTNLVPFSLDIGSSETMHANGLGGDDTITVGDVGDLLGDRLGRPGQRHADRRWLVRDVPRRIGQRHDHPGGGLDVVSGDDGDDRRTPRRHGRRGPRRRR